MPLEPEGGSARNQVKDLGFVLDAANVEGIDLPLSKTGTDKFTDMVAQGDGALDQTGIHRTIAQCSAASLRDPA